MGSEGSYAVLLTELNSRLRRWNLLPMVLAAGFTASALIGICGGPLVAVLGLWTATCACALMAERKDQASRRVSLFYELDNRSSELFERVLEGFREMMTSSRKELVEEKRVASNLRRIRATALADSSSEKPPCVETNVATPGLHAGRQSLYLFPDFLMVVNAKKRKVELCTYQHLSLECGRSPVVEASPPDDAELLPCRYGANGSGRSVDAIRGKCTPGLQVAVYDWLRLSSPAAEIDLLLQFSKPRSTTLFVSALREAGVSVVRSADDETAAR